MVMDNLRTGLLILLSSRQLLRARLDLGIVLRAFPFFLSAGGAARASSVRRCLDGSALFLSLFSGSFLIELLD